MWAESAEAEAEAEADAGAGLVAVVAPLLAVVADFAPSLRIGSAYANYTGAAPVEVAGADKTRHRLSCGGDRQLNSALHTIAITQIRMSGTLGNAYYKTKLAEGKTPREAKRCLKRRLADHVWRVMTSDERRHTALPSLPDSHPA